MVEFKDEGEYGWELVLDLHGCNVELFSREHIDGFFTDLCELIGMEKCEVYFWDDLEVPEEERQVLPHTKGTSAVCFILTSSIVVHTLELLGAAYINVFSCKAFDAEEAAECAMRCFGAVARKTTVVQRTLPRPNGEPENES